MAAAMATWAMRSASATFWLSQIEKASWATPLTKADASRDDSRSFVCPVNWGSFMRTERT